MANVYVIIPHYEKWNLTHARLWELMKFESKNITEVLVVDDGSMDNQTEGGLRWWAELSVKTGFKVSALSLEENVGFLLASNAGIRHILSKCSPDDVIILLSNDVQIMTEFIGQVTEILGHQNRIVGGVLYDTDTGWNKFSTSTGSKIYPYLEGWLLAMKASDWETFNGFDERFAPCIFEDVDLSTTALALGYELVPLNNPGLFHMSGGTITYNESRHELTRLNQEKFRKKWIKK